MEFLVSNNENPHLNAGTRTPSAGAAALGPTMIHEPLLLSHSPPGGKRVEPEARWPSDSRSWQCHAMQKTVFERARQIVE
jgi:hypothetical protein